MLPNREYIFQTEAEEEVFKKKRSKTCEKKYKLRQKHAKVEPPLEEEFMSGRVLGMYYLIIHLRNRIVQMMLRTLSRIA